MTILNCNIPTPNAIREQVELHTLAKQENLQERIAAAQSEKVQKMFSVAKEYLEKVNSGHIVSFPVLALEVGTDSHLRQVMFEVAQAFVSMPGGAVIDVKTETALGALNAKYIVAYNEDGSANVNYTVEQFNEFDIENPDAETKSEITGTATINADGTCTGIDANVASIAAGTAIDLTAVAANATVNEAGDILTVVVPAASTNSVLGISVASDVTLVISISSTGVDSIVITYTGASITCKYN